MPNVRTYVCLSVLPFVCPSKSFLELGGREDVTFLLKIISFNEYI